MKNNKKERISLHGLIIPLVTFQAIISPLLQGCSSTNADEKPDQNVVLLLFDDLRYDQFSYRGGEARTPFIDSLASESVCFNAAMTTTGLCSPSRSVLFTGRWGHRTGLDDNINLWHSKNRGLSKSTTTLLEWALGKNYTVGYFGKWHLGPVGPAKRGVKFCDEKEFDTMPDPYLPVREEQKITTYYDAPSRKGEKDLYYHTLDGTYSETSFHKKIEKGIRFIQSHSNGSGPVFLTISFNQPHPPYKVPEPYASMYPEDSVSLPASFTDQRKDKPLAQDQILWPWHDVGHMTGADWKKMRSFYYGAVSMIDRGIGELISTLKETGLYDHTLIVLVGDQGSMMGEHRLYDKGPYCYDELMRIPLIIKVPGQTPRQVNRQVSIMDINQTLVEWMNLDPPVPNVDSRSLFPLIEKGDDGWTGDDLAFYHYEWYNGSWFGIRTIRTPEWKYCWNPADRDELYSLKEDPDEVINLAENPDYQNIQSYLRLKLLNHLEQTDDPLSEWLEESCHQPSN